MILDRFFQQLLIKASGASLSSPTSTPPAIRTSPSNTPSVAAGPSPSTAARPAAAARPSPSTAAAPEATAPEPGQMIAGPAPSPAAAPETAASEPGQMIAAPRAFRDVRSNTGLSVATSAAFPATVVGDSRESLDSLPGVCQGIQQVSLSSPEPAKSALAKMGHLETAIVLDDSDDEGYSARS